MSEEPTNSGRVDVEREVLALVARLVAELRPGGTAPVAGLDSVLDRDLGLDSLARAELIARLERRFGVALPERAFAEADTARDLARFVAGASGRIEAVAAAAPVSAVPVAGAPTSAATLVEVVEWHLERHPERLHARVLERDGAARELTYASLWQGARAVAGGLKERGIAPGERVAMMLPTSADYFFSFLGTLLAGAVPVPIYPPVRASQLADHVRRHGGILRNAAASILLTVPEARAVGRLLKAEVPGLEVAAVADVATEAGSGAFPRAAAGDTAFIQYTSGSTGNPKGVVLSHANLLANIRAMGRAVRASSEDVFVSWLPLYHDMGLIGAWLGSLYYAIRFVVMSPVTFLVRPYRWLEAIDTHRGTLSAAPNFAYELCVARVSDEDLARLDLSCWRAAFNGAEPVSPATIARFTERFSRAGFRPGAMMPVYGLAEASVGLAFPPSGEPPVVDCVARDAFSRSGRAEPVPATDANALCFVGCGVPLAGHEVRIVDADERELPERREGRLQFRGPSCTSGYYRSAEETSKLFSGDWLNSGDRAYVAGGRIFVTGRSKDVIIRGGRNVYPHELEEAVGATPGVRKGCVAAFGAHDAESGTEQLVIVAETKLTAPDDLQRLAERIVALASDLAGVPPDDVVLSPPHTVLKTSSGKVRRSACRALYETGHLAPATRPGRLALALAAVRSVVPRPGRAAERIAAIAYAGWAWAMFGVFALAGSAAVLLLPRRSWRWRAARALLRAFAFCAMTRLDVRGLSNLPPSGTACVYVANHMSYLDGYALIAAVPRTFSFIAKAEFRAKPLLRRLLERLDVEFVERFDAERGVADAARLTALARGGRNLFFFPEGTFTRTPGLAGFRLGAFLAAVDAGVPVVPLAVRGTRSILRADSWFPRRGRIAVEFGPPLENSGEPSDRWSAALDRRERTRAWILAHCGEPDLEGGSR